MIEEYVYVNRGRLQRYAEQIDAAVSKTKLVTKKVGLSLTGPTVAGEQSVATRPATVDEMAKAVIEHLRSNGQLFTSRPETEEEIESSGARFVLETMSARKVTFEVGEVPGLKNLKALSVWASNPLQKPSEILEANAANKAAGMFVYLLEGYWESEDLFSHGTSEFSALSHLLAVLGLGSMPAKDDFASPISILKRAGGIETDQRRIETLYRIREVSDNQFVRVGTTVARSYDLYGYPIYIIER